MKEISTLVWSSLSLCPSKLHSLKKISPRVSVCFAFVATNLTGTMNIFSKKPTAKEALRESKREMANATRGIEKEIGALQLEEKKLVAEIKRTAKTGNEAATKILARQLVRLRQQISNLQGSRAQMRGIATHTQAMHAQSSVAVGMKGASKAMAAMNKAQVIREFQKQSAQMDMTTEMMSDAIDDALDDDEAEEETDELTNQVLDEIGVDVASQLSAAPKGRIAAKNTEGVGSSGTDELEKRLAALRNP
ncbi:vacuolar protein sorting-associated protein 2.3 [Prunus dulcis]|uniref:Vacuolar protein sorting-associated protein 2.3 n=1 Tax=Prunus dulcis TaxID=3755 RepID=A0A4Y1S0A7_PRUDU|nr:vacuolar protein sorting-associated protein 2.3 [Prunus dulcis]